MNFGPLAELERDICLLEDVAADALDAWTHASQVAITPRSEERIKRTLVRATQVSDQVRQLCGEVRTLLVNIERERRGTR